MTDDKTTGGSHVVNLLNQIEAMLDAGLTTQADLAEFIFKHAPQKNPNARLADWIKGRDRQPSGEYALRMHQFCIGKTSELIDAPEESKEAYREAFKAVEERRK